MLLALFNGLWRSPFAASEDRNLTDWTVNKTTDKGGARRSRRARIATPPSLAPRGRWARWRSPFAASEDRNSQNVPDTGNACV